jgi:type II secretory pathway pseudopilin PulG
MTNSTTARARTAPRIPAAEQGYMLLAVVFLTLMVLIALSVAAPQIAKSIQRDREIELMHRGKQYQRAIQLYYRKFGAYPPTMDALEKANNIRFLRKRYKDPFTGKDEWHLIHFGEAKTQTLGFFGQPIAGTGSAGGSVLAGIGPSGGNQAQPTGGPLFGGSTLAPSGTSTDPNSTANNGSTDSSGQGNASGTTTGTGSTTGSTTNSPTRSGFGSSTSGQTFGGGGIIGVESTSTKLAILEYKKKKHYNEWEFVYDPLADRKTISSSAGAIGSPIGNSPMGSSPTAGSASPSGNSIGNSNNSNSGTGTSSSTTPQP